MKIMDLTGQPFGRWIVISRAENTNQGQAQWLVRCECGTEKIVKSIVLRNGNSQSCGCRKLEMNLVRSTKHGHSSSTTISPTYHTWAGMIARCTNPKNKHYDRYGGRGITVCERWRNSFADFLADMGDKPKGKTLDRRFNDGNYEPSNCEWATGKRQSRNKSNNRVISFNEQSHTLIEWAEILGISQSSLRERLDKWPRNLALTAPKGSRLNQL